MKLHASRTAFFAAAFVLAGSGYLLSQPSPKAVVNHFVSDPKQNTVLYITDFEGSAPEVTVYFYSNEGDIIGSKTVSVPRNSTLPLRPHEVVKREENGNVRIISNGGPIVAEYWQVISDDEYNYSVAVPSQPAQGHKNLIVQHFVSDPDLVSVIYLTNPGESSASVTLEFNDTNGNLVGNKTGTIAPNATLKVQPHEVLQKKTYGNVHIKSTVPVTGEYWQQQNQEVKDATGKSKDMRYTVAIPIQSIESF